MQVMESFRERGIGWNLQKAQSTEQGVPYSEAKPNNEIPKGREENNLLKVKQNRTQHIKWDYLA